MKQLLIGIIATMAFTACATPPQPGYGGVDPAFDNLVAIATQTGAAHIAIQTETAKTATAQAIYAEQTAVSYQATASKEAEIVATQAAFAQETAVSATETAVHLPVSVQQTADAQAVLMARENAASTATAVAIQSEIAENAKAVERMDKFWHWFFIFLGGLGVALIIAAVNWALHFHRPVDPVFDDHGNLHAVDNRHYQLTNSGRQIYRGQPVMIDQPKEEPKPMFTAPTPTRPAKVRKQDGETIQVDVLDRNPEIDPHKWYLLACAILIDEVKFTRRAITEHDSAFGASISQNDYTAMYGYIIENELAVTGAGDAIDMSRSPDCYEFLVNKLPDYQKGLINLPCPSGYELVLDNQ